MTLPAVVERQVQPDDGRFVDLQQRSRALSYRVEFTSAARATGLRRKVPNPDVRRSRRPDTQNRTVDALLALLIAAALQAGFQVTVTVVVYPALVATPAQDWAVVHAAHSRRIGPVVAVVYGLLLASWAWVVTSVAFTPALWVAATGSLVTGPMTALLAAPTHGRLARVGPRPDLLRRLVRADLARLVGALITLGGALAAATNTAGAGGQ